MTTKRSWVLLPALALLFALGAAPAKAADKTKCDLKFSVTEWSAVVEHASGKGMITCENGKSIPVTITSKGAGLTAGKFKIDDGHGEFNAVTNPEDLLGDYGAAEASLGVVKSGQTMLMTKGDVTLALAGHGEGWNVGVSFSKFTLSRR